MKRVVTILLLVFIVTVNTPAGELLKLPQLIEHFRSHKKENGLTLFKFLAIHYGTDHTDADFPEDEQLPFKNVLLYNISQGIVAPFIQPADISFSQESIILILFSSSIPHSEPSSVFHPPRVNS